MSLTKHFLYLSQSFLCVVFRYAGELESDLSSRVVRAVQQAPSVLVLEEIDLLCPDRSNASDTQKRLVSCLLRLIDELRNHRVFIVGKLCH